MQTQPLNPRKTTIKQSTFTSTSKASLAAKQPPNISYHYQSTIKQETKENYQVNHLDESSIMGEQDRSKSANKNNHFKKLASEKTSQKKLPTYNHNTMAASRPVKTTKIISKTEVTQTFSRYGTIEEKDEEPQPRQEKKFVRDSNPVKQQKTKLKTTKNVECQPTTFKKSYIKKDGQEVRQSCDPSDPLACN